ncbi:MAG: PTS sugar transporter subunit IIA [Fusobacteriaceae bacterium]
MEDKNLDIQNKMLNVEKNFSSDELINYFEEDFTKEEILKKMVSLIAKNSEDIDECELFENVMAREKIGSTGIGLGIAIPHGRIVGGKKMTMAISLLKNPIAFDSIDGEPVKFIIMVTAPMEQGKEYLEMIATLIRAFRNQDYLKRVINATNSSDLKKALEDFR